MFFFSRCTAPELSPPSSPPQSKKIDPLTTHLRNLVCVLAGRSALLKIDLGNIEVAPEIADQRAKDRRKRTATIMKTQLESMNTLFQQLLALLLSVSLDELAKESVDAWSPLPTLICLTNDQLLQYTRKFIEPFLAEPPATDQPPPSAAAAATTVAAE